jgi:hypothetical protein
LYPFIKIASIISTAFNSSEGLMIPSNDIGPVFHEINEMTSHRMKRE